MLAGQRDKVDRAEIASPSGRTGEFKNLSAGKGYLCTEGKGCSALDHF